MARRPAMASWNSRWPLPATPATPTIWPRRTSTLAPSTAVTPLVPRRPAGSVHAQDDRRMVEAAQGVLACLGQVLGPDHHRGQAGRGPVSAVSTVPALRPSRRTVTRSVWPRISSILCDTSTTEWPCWAMWRTTS